MIAELKEMGDQCMMAVARADAAKGEGVTMRPVRCLVAAMVIEQAASHSWTCFTKQRRLNDSTSTLSATTYRFVRNMCGYGNTASAHEVLSDLRN